MTTSLTVPVHNQRSTKPQKEKVSSQTEGHEPLSNALPSAAHETEQRTFYLSVLAFLFSCAAFAVSGVNQVSSRLHHQIVVVDMNQLLRQKAAAIVGQETETAADAKTALKRAEQARQIRAQIDAYAAKNHVIVATKGAVFGAHLKEVTDDIRALL